MKKKLLTVFLIIVILLIGFEMLTHVKSILEAVRFSFQLWVDNIFPSLFPFFVLSDVLINIGFTSFIGELLSPLISKTFKLKGDAGFVIIMSMISGFPSNARCTRELYDRGIINEKEATKLLTFTHFPSPMFVLGTVAVSFLNDIKIGILILIIIYISNFIIGLLFRNYYSSLKTENRASLKKAFLKMHNIRINNNLNFGQILSKSLKGSIETLLLILGIISTFLVLTTIINNNIDLTLYNKAIVNGFFEITQGLKYISIININIRIKVYLCLLFVSFGGLSVHLQIMSIISDTKIKYLPFLLARVLQTGIGSILFFLLYNIYC